MAHEKNWVPGPPTMKKNLPGIKIPKSAEGTSFRRNAGGKPSTVGGGTIKKSGALSYGNGKPRSSGGGARGSTRHFGESVGNSGGPSWRGPSGPMSSMGFREKA